MKYSWEYVLLIIENTSMTPAQRFMLQVQWAAGQAIEKGVNINQDFILAQIDQIKKEHRNGK